MTSNHPNIQFSKSPVVCLLMLCLAFGNVHAAENSEVVKSRFTPDDFSHWLNAAYIAEATYNSDEEIAAALDLQGYKITHLQKIEGFSVAYVLATNEKSKQHILAVRGTSNIENAIVDAAFVLVPDKLSGIDIHQGFLLSARDIYQQIKPEISPGYTINTIGHSLGGAAALILAMMLDAQGYSVGEVITFGQPKVTNVGGSKHFEHLNITRFVNPKDMVPLMPPVDPMDLMNLSIFWHQGTEILLHKDKRYSVLTGINSMMRAADFLNDMPSEQHLSNHFMSTYISNIKTKLISPEEIKYKSDFKFSDWFGSPAKTN